MLRQLARLTRRVPAAGPDALALAVYSAEDGESFGARETGVEGVACVDDAARASVLLMRLWARTGNRELKRWAEGLLEFVLWMHAGDGRWFNFIFDWEGTRNFDGHTSAPGTNFWQARATESLAVASALLGHRRAQALSKLAFAAAAESAAPSDVRAIHALAALESLRAEPDPWLCAQLGRWCDEISECTADGMLMNSPDERGQPHLWGHVQEAVLIEAGSYLGRPAFIASARNSADAVFAEVIDSGFDLPHVRPYDVQSTVLVMDRMLAETGDQRYSASAAKARAWFDGRNPAQAPVYMRESGRVSDGVDHGTINRHSGAEANIAAGLALVDDDFVLARASAYR